MIADHPENWSVATVFFNASPCLYSRRSSSSGVGRWKNAIQGFIIASGI
jgi:hypothetical protein